MGQDRLAPVSLIPGSPRLVTAARTSASATLVVEIHDCGLLPSQLRNSHPAP